QMSSEAQRFVRLAFQRLVTPERTRAIVDIADLLALASKREEGQRVIEQLVQARLLIVQARGEADGHAVEIVHESLITGWPRLRRWLDESQEDSAMLAQLHSAAKQWDSAGRPAGLLWRGEAAEQARRFNARSTRELPERERAYLTAVIRLATRSTRVKRIAIGAVMAVLGAIAVAAFVVIAMIRGAEQTARDEATRAQSEAQRAKAAEDNAKLEAEKAKAAEKQSADRLREIEEKDQVVAKGKEDLRTANTRLEGALGVADEARRKAEAANAELKRINAAQEAELKKLRKANRPF
ncbi:MAG TPA: AAA family ATPase, partial [Kofleriaceae bacterium]